MPPNAALPQVGVGFIPSHRLRSPGLAAARGFELRGNGHPATA